MSYQHDFFVPVKTDKDGHKFFTSLFYSHHEMALAAMFRTAKNIELSAEVMRQLKTLLQNATYVGFVSIPGDSKLGYLIASGGQIVDLYVEQGYRRQGVASQLIKEFMFHNELKYPQFTAIWYADWYNVSQLFTKAGFYVTAEFDQGITTRAATPINDAYYSKVLDEVDRSYIDFREYYAVVDGHYTLEELEALLVVARKELKHAE